MGGGEGSGAGAGWEVGVAVRIDLAAQDALGTGDCELSDLVTQLFLGALGGQGCFFFGSLLGGGDDLAGLRTGLFEQLPGLALGA